MSTPAPAPHARPPAIAGMFYPADAGELKAAVDGYLDDARRASGFPGSGLPGSDLPDSNAGPLPKAIIAPHAGFKYSGPIAATAYAHLIPAADTIRRVILLGPCHRVAVRGLAASSADVFTTPLGDVPLDAEALASVIDLPQVEVFDAPHAEEHSLEVHLPFLQSVLKNFTLLPLVVGAASPEEVADVLDILWGGPETLIVISSDLSHYLEYNQARLLDMATSAAIEKLDGGAIADDQACGRVPVKGLLHLAKQRDMTVNTVDLRNSGDTAGPRGQVVGYGSWLFFERDDGRGHDDRGQSEVSNG